MPIIKFVLAILLLPVVYASAVSFKLHLALFPSTYDEIFFWGVGIFLLTFIFVYQYHGIQEFGEKFSQGALKMFSPVDRFVSYLFPFYSIAICILFFITKNFLKIENYDEYFLFFIGFTLTMHVLLVAQTMQEEERGAVKPNYLLSMAVIFIVNIFMLVFSLDVINLEATFPKYFNLVYDRAMNVFMLLIGMAAR